MNPFSPFVAEWLPNQTLRIALTPKKRLMFFLWMIGLPAIIIAGVLIAALMMPRGGLPDWFYNLYSLILLFCMAIIFLVKWVVCLQLHKDSITVQYFHFFKLRTTSITTDTIQHIKVKTSRSRSAGFYYYAVLKNGSQTLILNLGKWIPKEEDKIAVSAALHKACGIEVKG